MTASRRQRTKTNPKSMAATRENVGSHDCTFRSSLSPLAVLVPVDLMVEDAATEEDLTEDAVIETGFVHLEGQERTHCYKTEKKHHQCDVQTTDNACMTDDTHFVCHLALVLTRVIIVSIGTSPSLRATH